MTDEDFDKDVENEEFSDEFDFVDDGKVHHESAHAGADSATITRAPGNNMVLFSVIGLVLLVVAFFGYKFVTGDSSKSITKANTASATATPLPTPVAHGSATTLSSTPASSAEATPHQHETGSTPGAGEGSLDFDKAYDKAATTSADQLSEALPQPSKSFEQVQKDLKSDNAAKKTAIPEEINATLDSISEEMTLNVNQIKHLESTITNLASTLDQLNKSISAMDNRVLGLTETVDGLAQDLSNVKRIMADEDIDLTNNKKVRFSGAKVPNIGSTSQEYTVHAIIPGRAWLKTSSGQIVTVTEGDKVGDFGTVAVIDAANGIVRTSSGITFR